MKIRSWEIKCNASGFYYLVAVIFSIFALARFCYETDLYEKVENGFFSVLLILGALGVQDYAKISINKVKKNEWGEDDTKLES